MVKIVGNWFQEDMASVVVTIYSLFSSISPKNKYDDELPYPWEII